MKASSYQRDGTEAKKNREIRLQSETVLDLTVSPVSHSNPLFCSLNPGTRPTFA
jgi:hypothetical protein